MPHIERTNPYAAFNFILKGASDPSLTAAFMEVSGLDGENALIEYREGSDQQGQNAGNFVRKQPGLERYPNVTFRRGITGNLLLWQGRKRIRDATSYPGQLNYVKRDFVVELQDEQHKTVLRWILRNGWVVKLSGPSLNAKSNEIAIESIELACERIEIDDT